MLSAGLSGAVLLMALATGYLVCSIAKKELGIIKTVGYIIGIGIIMVAGLSILNGLLIRTRFHKKCSGMESTGMMQGQGGIMMKDVPMPAPKK